MSDEFKMVAIKTVNELVGAMARRAGELSGERVGTLRRWHPDNDGEESGGEEFGHFTKGECIEAILYEEFGQVFDVQMDEPIIGYPGVGEGCNRASVAAQFREEGRNRESKK